MPGKIYFQIFFEFDENLEMSTQNLPKNQYLHNYRPTRLRVKSRCAHLYIFFYFRVKHCYIFPTNCQVTNLSHYKQKIVTRVSLFSFPKQNSRFKMQISPFLELRMKFIWVLIFEVMFWLRVGFIWVSFQTFIFCLVFQTVLLSNTLHFITKFVLKVVIN